MGSKNVMSAFLAPFFVLLWSSQCASGFLTTLLMHSPKINGIEEQDEVTDIVMRWWWGGDPDERHPVSGMSRRDVYNVQKSWAKINADPSASGFLIFSRLFEADPESKTFFSYIADATEEEMVRNFTFKGHIVYIMASLDTAVRNVSQPEVVVPIMHKLGHSHHRRHIRRKHFMVLRDVLVNILQNDLQFGEDVVGSWALFVSFMYEHIFTIIKD